MSKKILVIEDNPQDQKIIQRYLGKNGFSDVLIAESGEKGIESALQNAPDMILLDTMLPGIDGFETCRQLKQEKNVSAKVVIMTGRIDAVDAEKARRMGADEYCVKTSDCVGLLAVVTKIAASLDAVAAQSAAPFVPGPAIEAKQTEAASQWGQEKTNEAIKALYRELEKKNEELKALDKLKSEFVAMVSHELRTPLTIITSALAQIIDGIYGEVNKDQEQRILMALRNANLLRRIIDDLLDMSKIEAKAVNLNRRSLNIVTLGSEVAGSFHGLVKEKGLDLEFHSSDESIEAEVDRDRIYQVLTNLIGNAIKFTEKGKIEVHLTGHPDFVEVRVSDTGRGISADDLPKVFGRFQQFGKSFQRGHEGTGLGLAISKGLVELHQGTIRVESVLEKGTSFVFRLPKKAVNVEVGE